MSREMHAFQRELLVTQIGVRRKVEVNTGMLGNVRSMLFNANSIRAGMVFSCLNALGLCTREGPEKKIISLRLAGRYDVLVSAPSDGPALLRPWLQAGPTVACGK